MILKGAARHKHSKGFETTLMLGYNGSRFDYAIKQGSFLEK